MPMKMGPVKVVQGMVLLAALLGAALPRAARAEEGLRGEVSVRVVQPYGWGSTAAHLVIYPVGGGSFLMSRYTSFSGNYVGRLPAGRYLVNAHGFGGGFGSAEFAVSPGETSSVDVALIGSAFTRLHYRHRLGLLHAEHRLKRDRVMLAVHQHLALVRASSSSRHLSRNGGTVDESTASNGHRTVSGGTGTAAAGGDEWDHLAHVAEEPGLPMPRAVARSTPSPVGHPMSPGRAVGVPAHVNP